MARSRNMHRKPRSRHGRRRKPGMLKKLLLTSALALIPIGTLGAGGYLANIHLSREQIDANYCYQRADQEQVATFIDFSLTHQISQSQQRDLRNTLMQTFASLPPNGRVLIFTTANDSTASVTDPVFMLCNPAATALEQASIGAPDTSAQVLARQQREASERYTEFVDELIRRSTQQSHLATSSPILEQIQGISRYNFAAPLSKLIIYTDGINNSATARFCAVQGELPRFEVFARRPNYRFIKPDNLSGAEVNILLVEQGELPSASLPFCTNQELRDFYLDYAKGNGAGAVRVTPLGYGASQ
ncbi:MAG: hypothetical protein AAF636_20615 [Pseudomonadota bacterium]